MVDATAFTGAFATIESTTRPSSVRDDECLPPRSGNDYAVTFPDTPPPR